MALDVPPAQAEYLPRSRWRQLARHLPVEGVKESGHVGGQRRATAGEFRLRQRQTATIADQDVQIGVSPHPLGRFAQPLLAAKVDCLGKDHNPVARIRGNDLFAMPLVAIEIAEVAAAVADKDRAGGKGGKAEIVGVPLPHNAKVSAGRPHRTSPHNQVVAGVAMHGIVKQGDPGSGRDFLIEHGCQACLHAFPECIQRGSRGPRRRMSPWCSKRLGMTPLRPKTEVSDLHHGAEVAAQPRQSPRPADPPPSLGAPVDKCPFRQKLKTRVPRLDDPSAADAPAETGGNVAKYAGVRLLAYAQRRRGMEQQLGPGQAVGDLAKQLPNLRLLKIWQHPFGDDQQRLSAPASHVVDPGEIEDRPRMKRLRSDCS